ncbi:MAG TPA: flagellar export chaperone FliS [Clostridium sp.]|jgi:flagellar protein FliS|nr:flagellar export chaperone FliS [Clostridium sp.]
MALNNPYAVYKQNSVNFASKEQLLLMLVDGAVKFSKLGRQAIMDKKISVAHENIVKTQDIFYELMATLDVEKGGDWAKQLMSVYDFIVRRLVEANLKKDLTIMEEVLPIIVDVRNTWHDAYKAAKGVTI